MHAPLPRPDDAASYVGAYWDGTKLVVTGDLGSDQEQAIQWLAAPREYLAHPDGRPAQESDQVAPDP